jgi:hypothetical protein
MRIVFRPQVVHDFFSSGGETWLRKKETEKSQYLPADFASFDDAFPDDNPNPS